jgi:MFS family permease
MALWFSATAVIPLLLVEWHLDESTEALLTMSVQIGFVVGTLISAIFNLSDIFNARYVFSISAFLGAALNGAIGLFVTSIGPALMLRFLTGVCLAGVYPPAMKIMATWFKKGRGMAIGVLVGALVVGSASPHLFKVLGSPSWRKHMLIASASSIISGLICLLFVKDGPYLVKGTKFDWRYVGKTIRDQGVRLGILDISVICGSYTLCGLGYQYFYWKATKRAELEILASGRL